MIKIVLFLMFLLFTASTIKIYFKYNIEISLFIAFCGSTVLIAIFTLIGIMQAGIILVYTISIFSLVFILYYFIKSPSELKKALPEIFTPGIVVFILSCLIYYVVIADKVLIHDDEAGSWARQVKYMYETNSYKSFSGHGHILGFFTLLTLKVIGFKDAVFFWSLWMFKWCAILLPFNNIKWNKWHKVLLYSIGAFGIINITHEIEPAYYMDVMLGLLAGTICAAWSLSTPTKKDYIWLYMGLVVISNIKDELSAIIAILTSLYCFVSACFKRGETNKSKSDYALNYGILLISFIFVLSSSTFKGIIGQLLSLIGHLNFSIIVVAIAVTITLTIVFRRKVLSFFVKKKKILIIFSSFFTLLFAIVLFSAVYSRVSVDSWRRVELLLFRLYSNVFFGKTMYTLLLFAVIFISISGIVLVEKKHVRTFVLECGYILLSVLFFTIVIFIGYMLKSEELFNHYLKSLTRYCSVIIVFASMWLFAKMVKMETEYKIKNGDIIAGLVLCLVFASQIPVIGSTAFSNLDPIRYTFTYQLRPDIKKDANFIKENIDSQKLLIISSSEANPWDPFTATLWLTYELTEIDIKRIIITDGSDYIFTIINHDYSTEELLEYIERENFKYVYFYNKNSYIEEKYLDIMEYTEADTSILYEVTPESENYLSFLKSDCD